MARFFHPGEILAGATGKAGVQIERGLTRSYGMDDPVRRSTYPVILTAPFIPSRLPRAFLDEEGPRPLNSKSDNALLGVTNIRGLLGEHDVPVGALDEPRVRAKKAKARKKLESKYNEYTRRFIKDETGDPVLPVLNVTKDGVGQVRTAQFSATILRKGDIYNISAHAKKPQEKGGLGVVLLAKQERQGMEAHDSASLTSGSSRAARVAAVMPWAGLQSRERPATPVGEQAGGQLC